MKARKACAFHVLRLVTLMNEKFIFPLLGDFGRKQWLYVLMTVPSYKRYYIYMSHVIEIPAFLYTWNRLRGKRVADQRLSLSLHR